MNNFVSILVTLSETILGEKFIRIEGLRPSSVAGIYFRNSANVRVGALVLNLRTNQVQYHWLLTSSTRSIQTCITALRLIFLTLRAIERKFENR